MIASFPPMITFDFRVESSLLGNWTDQRSVAGFSFFFTGIYFLFILSILFVFLLRVKLGLIIGFVGCIIMGLNILFPLLFNPIMLLNLYNFYYAQDPSALVYLTSSSNSEYLYIQVIIWILFFIENFILLFGKIVVKDVNLRMVKETILDLGTQYANLEVREISEACKIDKAKIIDIIKEMIENNEIFAEYFKSSKTVAFNKQANIKEIDSLMAIYQEWEEGQEGKI